MSTPLTLFNASEGQIVIGPNTRFRIVIEKGNGGLLFGYILDRDRNNAIEVEIEDTDFIRILVRLVARGITRGLITPPTQSEKIGIVYDEREGTKGCYTMEGGQHDTPLVIAIPSSCFALAWIAEGKVAAFFGATPEVAMIHAVSAFVTHRAAA